MKLVKQLKKLYPEYFWAVFGSTALKMYDQSQAFQYQKEEKLKGLKPKDIDVVTNAKICSGAFKDLLEMLDDVVQIDQANEGKYPIECINKRITVHMASGEVYDFIFVRLDTAKEWLEEQFSIYTQCIIECPLCPGEDGTITSMSFRQAYTLGAFPKSGEVRISRHCTPAHRQKIERIKQALINQ